MDESQRFQVDAEGELDDLLDLKAALDLPDRLPPLRLPSEDELAAYARNSELLGQAGRLVTWVGDRPRRLSGGELTAADTVAAARALGVAVPKQQLPDALPGMPDKPAVRRMRDVPRVAQLWELAVDLELVTATGTAARPGPAASLWPDGADGDVLDVWEGTLGAILYGAVPLESSAADDLDPSGVVAAAFVMLFLARGEGLPVAEIRQMIDERSDTDAGGDPVDALLTVLAEHGAVVVDADTSRLTPLSLYAVRLQLIEAGVEVPLLPRVEKMTASDLAAVGAGGSADDLVSETAAWLELRSPETAVDELLAVAATVGPAERMTVTSIAAELASSGEARWREALDEPMLRPYAKLALAQLAGAHPEDPSQFPPEFRPTLTDLALLVTDTLAGMAESLEPDELMEQLSETVPAGEEERLFDQMWRLDHPDAHGVLMTVGTHHPDKKLAKAARKAAYRIKPPANR